MGTRLRAHPAQLGEFDAVGVDLVLGPLGSGTQVSAYLG
jgi:hypothetical protein